MFILNPSALSLLRESSDLNGRINLPGAPMSPAFLYARGVRQGSVEERDRLRPISTSASFFFFSSSANFDFGQFRLRPISTSANFDFELSEVELAEVEHPRVEGPDMWNQVLDNALREPAGRWESEGIGFMLAKDYRNAKKRRGPSGDDVKDAGRVLHHFAGRMICTRWQVQRTT